MEDYYNKEAKNPIKINTGGFYIAFCDDMWCRIRALQVFEKEVMCFFIDFGDEYLIPKSQLFVLNRRFARHQAQVKLKRIHLIFHV